MPATARRSRGRSLPPGLVEREHASPEDIARGRCHFVAIRLGDSVGLWAFLGRGDEPSKCVRSRDNRRISVVGGPGIEPGTSAL